MRGDVETTHIFDMFAGMNEQEREYLNAVARARQCSVAVLGRRLLQVIASDRLVNATLDDDGAPIKIARKKRTDTGSRRASAVPAWQQICEEQNKASGSLPAGRDPSPTASEQQPPAHSSVLSPEASATELP